MQKWKELVLLLGIHSNEKLRPTEILVVPRNKQSCLKEAAGTRDLV